ncbi:MAG: Gfo/Idh/MocA family oxidoreductase [Zoogloea sp.]|nr:Gfo/Idh/MocA family oxidoreductase [Zoogloea sp.]
MRILIVGTGSIGRRHVASLQALVARPQFVLLRSGGREDDYSRALGATVAGSWEAALDTRPALAVIATPSFLHLEALAALLPAGVPCYVEKPVVADEDQLAALQGLLAGLREEPATLAGCNLRFLPSLARLRTLLRDGAIGRVARASLQVGQWLPDWRPAQDYAAGYSADPLRGGGVVLDLVHELDAARWLFGEFTRLHAVGGHYSRLEIASEDSAALLLGRTGGPVVCVGLDYVARSPVRRYELIGEEGSLVWDLPARRLALCDARGTTGIVCTAADFDTAATYPAAMRELLAAVRERRPSVLDIHEGLRSAALALQANRQVRSA